ncbi:MAG TPA: ABC transporter permease [Firmicutes bacterium]|nr:ABC transporter permease [Bacillota bacterium]
MTDKPEITDEVKTLKQPAGILLLPFALAGWIVTWVLQPIINTFDYFGRMLIMTAHALWYIVTLRIPVGLTIQQMSHLGTDSLFIVTLCLGFTGMILSTILTQQAMELGFGTEYIGGGVVYAMAKDLVPVLGGLVMAGRVGAGIASEIGTMQVTEQIDALRALAVPPVRHLVVPRLIACAAMVPAISFIGGFIGIWAGWIPVHYWVPGANISHRIYFDSVFYILSNKLLWIAARKSLYFGIIIALVACQEGFATKGGARGVGVTVTRAVVISMVFIFIADLILTL